VEKERRCKGCNEVLFTMGTLDDEGKHWGIQIKSLVTYFTTDDKGRLHMKCPKCGTMLQFIQANENQIRPVDD